MGADPKSELPYIGHPCCGDAVGKPAVAGAAALPAGGAVGDAEEGLAGVPLVCVLAADGAAVVVAAGAVGERWVVACAAVCGERVGVDCGAAAGAAVAVAFIIALMGILEWGVSGIVTAAAFFAPFAACAGDGTCAPEGVA